MELYCPDYSNEVGETNVWKWYNNVSIELEENFLNIEEKKYFRDYYFEAGLLKKWRRPFFRYHYSRTFTHAVNYLFSEIKNPLILDLGCGFGSQSLFLSLMGARVVGIDMDDMALDIFRKRKNNFEAKVGYELPIEIININAFDFDYKSIAPIGGVYSMFAFNMMQPSNLLLKKILEYSSDNCRIAIIDGNNQSWLPKLIPSRRRNVLSPLDFEKELQLNSFITEKHTQGVALPPTFWSIIPSNQLAVIDNFIGSNWLMAISHQIYAKKNG